MKFISPIFAPMHLYRSFVRPVLFTSDPEVIHHRIFRWLKRLLGNKLLARAVRSSCTVNDPALRRHVFGIDFPNPVGLAAGFDKDAKLVDELGCLGFGFIEIGTVTPVPQPGNEKPRMFRLPDDQALINRMGFNNDGASAAAIRLRKRKSRVIIGGNIGKNKITPNEQAGEDYEKCFRVLFDVVDYFVVNVSSPNTPGLRELQDREPLLKILNRLQQLNSSLSGSKNRKPVLLKIAPDLTNEQLDDIIRVVREAKLDGIIATNTSVSRDALITPSGRLEKIGAGGVSGKPLSKRSTEVIRYLAERSGNAFAIIGVGGIHSKEDALEKLDAGADLIQLYTGFIYEGPGLIKDINREIIRRSQNRN